MNHICGCTKVSAAEKDRSVCNICSGKPVKMLGSLGLEAINPNFNWKKAPKGKPRAVRRARTSFTSIIEKEPYENPERESKDRVKTRESAVSESEKVGVAILGQRFGDVLESIPIKKRRFLFRSPSPPPVIRDELNSCHSVISTDRERNLDSQGKKYGDCADFSGITILATAACTTETLERETLDKNYESSSNLTEDSPGSHTIIPLGNLASDDGKVSISKDARFHWDLNTVMEAWDSPTHEEKLLEVDEDIILERESSVDLNTSGQCPHGETHASLEVNCTPEVKSTTGSGVDFCNPFDKLAVHLEDSRKDVIDGDVKPDTMDGMADNGQLDEDEDHDHAREQESGGESCSKSEKMVDPTVEDESSSQYEDGEFIQNWRIDFGDDGDQEHVDYGSDGTGDVENHESAALEPSIALPEVGNGGIAEPVAESSLMSASVSGDSDLAGERKFVARKWEDSGSVRSARVRSSGWDRLPSGETTSGPLFRRRRERPYFHATRNETERPRERWAAEPPLRRQTSPGFFRQDAAAASIAKLESNGFVVAPDGTVLEAAAAAANHPPPPDHPRFGPKIGNPDRIHHHHSFSPTARSRSPPRRWRRSPEFRPRVFGPPPRDRISHRWDRGKLAEPPFDSCGEDRRYEDRFLHLGGGNRRYGGSSGKEGGMMNREFGRFRYGVRREEREKLVFEPRHFDEDTSSSRRSRYS